MRLNVTTERDMYGLTAATVVVGCVVALVTMHIYISWVLPVELHEWRQFLITAVHAGTLLTCLVVGVPMAYMFSSSLLHAHRLQQHITMIALTDHLTGLPNRAAVLDKIEAAVEAGVTTGKTGTVLFVDLDHFKKINDTYGHAGGDIALRHAAEIMRTTLGPNVILGRFGGEEFVCFIENAALAPAIAAKIIMAMRESRVSFGDQMIAVKASIGLANTDGSNDTKHLLSRADEALYIAKSSGRDCIVSHDEVALLRLVASSFDKPLRRRSTDNANHEAQHAA